MFLLQTPHKKNKSSKQELTDSDLAEDDPEDVESLKDAEAEASAVLDQAEKYKLEPAREAKFQSAMKAYGFENKVKLVDAKTYECLHCKKVFKLQDKYATANARRHVRLCEKK